MGMTSALLINSNEKINLLSPLFFIENLSLPQWLYTNAELVPLLPVLLIVGGFIVLTLTYVSWRKYKGEKVQKKQKQRDKLVD